MVVLLPVFVLAEGAAVASRVAAAARLTGFPPAVPAALLRQWVREQVDKNKSLFCPRIAQSFLFLT